MERRHCVVIPKLGKCTYQTVSAYGPISLLSCFGKVFDAIAARQLSKATAACGAISNAQMGARAQNYTLDALLRVVDPIAYWLFQMHGILHSYPPRPGLLAYDIAGAFNNTHPVLLDQVLEQRRMPTYLRKWTRAFNEDRRLGFALDSRIEEPRPFRCGLPQGSPVSPILFLIYAASGKKNPVPTEACVGCVHPVGDAGTRARNATCERTCFRNATGERTCVCKATRMRTPRKLRTASIVQAASNRPFGRLRLVETATTVYKLIIA
jgi:hypothetical protein